LEGRRGRRKGIYQKALDGLAGNYRIMKALITKDIAFVYLMDLDGNLQQPLPSNVKSSLQQQALTQLREFRNGAWEDGVSRPNPDPLSEFFWKRANDDSLYRLINRARELICYLEAYEMLRPTDYQGIWEEDIARRLIQFASNIYFMADIFSSEFARNNHRILVGSALGMAAVLFGEWGSTGSDETSRDGRSYMPKYWIGYAMSNINSVLFEQDNPQVFPDGGYNEGPHYLRFSMSLALPFFKAMKNFGEIFGISDDDYDPGDWTETYWTRDEEGQEHGYDLRSPWFGRRGNLKPDIHDILNWATKIRQPEGRLPAIADTYYESYFPETSVMGEHYFWPISSFDPGSSDPYWINWALQDFMENRPDFIAAGNLPQESPADWENMQIFGETGDIVLRSGWDLDDIYFHLYAKDYVYNSSPLYDYLHSHVQHDNTSFLIGYKGQVLALDCGYINWNRRGEVEGAANHNLILVNLKGPSKYNDKAQILDTSSTAFYTYVRINANYQSTNFKRNVLFCNDKYFVLNDQINGSRSNSYMFLLHGNDPQAQEISNGAIWQLEDAKLKSTVTSQLRGPALSTEYYMHYHDNGYDRTSQHKVLKVVKNTDDTQFLSIHFPYSASINPDPEIDDISSSAYAGFFVDRTSDVEYGNRYELIFSQWPVGSTISIAQNQYGSNNRTIKAIETDAEFAVLSFDPNTPHDPNTMELFARGMTYFYYGENGDTILYPNYPPQLDQIANQSVQEGSVLDVPVTALDPNYDIISFSVNNLPTFGTLIDNGDGTAIVRFTPGYFDAGDYPDIVVIAGDDETPQLTDQVSFNLQVQNLNLAPIAQASSNVQNGMPPMIVTFNGSDSYDPDHPEGLLAGYNWDFDDGTGSDLADLEHTYAAAGKYHVILTVSDLDGADDSDTIVVTNDAHLGKIYISEVSDAGNSDFYAFIEFYNDADYDIDLRECKLIQYDGQIVEGGAIEYYLEYIYDFGSDEQNPGSSTIIPAKGLLVISRGVTKSGFQGYWGVLPSNSNFNSGNSSLEFYRCRIWQLRYFDGTINDEDGSIIDDPQQFVSGQNVRSIQISRGVWWPSLTTPATPGRLESDQSLPVELISLSAHANKNNILLKWKTASELNNLGFIVQRSKNNDSLYKNIASYEVDQSLKGLGNSASGKEYTFIDSDVIAGILYWYKIIDVSFDGKYSEHGPVSAMLLPYEDNLSIPPKHYTLYNNYPNPFNSSTMIQFDIPEQTQGDVKTEINLYDILGRRIVQLYNGSLPTGRYRVNWDGKDRDGNMVPSGIYIYSMFSQHYTCSKKMILVR